MVKRSLQASPEGLKQARQAIARKGWTQEYLATEVGLKTRQPIGRFLAGKPVERRVFMELCFELDLNWEDIAHQPKGAAFEQIELDQDAGFDIDALVQKVRSQHYDKIQSQCGTLHILDIARSVTVDDIYIDVNLLEEITSKRWLEISDWVQGFNPDTDEFDRLGLAKVRQQRLSGLEAVERYSKLMVLGKPGSGKTTFLQYVAIQCNQGKFQAERLPIFIRLKNFASDARDSGEFSLLNYISEECLCGTNQQDIETVLNHGRALILLDGLDEVSEVDSDAVLQQIRKFSEKYYKNQFAITCRLAAQPYKFQGFTEVEVADFNLEQISALVKKWFVAVSRSRQEGEALASQFIEKLARPENKQIRELVCTPLLLNLTCLVFQAKAELPSFRSKLYEEGLDILLVKWDEARGIQRDEPYRNLYVAHKIKLLSQVAATTFEQGDYFFEQSKIQQQIADYLCKLPDAETDPVALQLDSEAVLKSIEAQHGLLVERSRRIYSFSHLTFQEYFAARNFADAGSQGMQALSRHVTEKRWHEVFLLTAGMLPKADDLLQLMKQQIDALLAPDEKLQQFLMWVNEKSLAAESCQRKVALRETPLANFSREGGFPKSKLFKRVETNRKPAAVRAFYFSLACAIDHYFICTLSISPVVRRPFPAFSYFPLPLYLSLVDALDHYFALDRHFAFDRHFAALNHELHTPDPTLTQALRRISVLEHALDCGLRFNLALNLSRAVELQRSLKQLKEQLPDSVEQTRFQAWWEANGQAWIEQLKAVMMEHLHAGHDWQFSKQQKQALMQYYKANRLLVECLDASYVTPAVRDEIENSLLLLE